MRVAGRLAAVQPSASASVSAMAKEFAGVGRSIIDLGMGEPDFATPGHIVDAAHAAAIAGQTKYPPTQGTMALRAAVADKFERENGLAALPDQVIVSTGAKQVLFGALMATLEPGDEVLLIAPHFDSYRSITNLLGGVPVVIATRPEDGFRLSSEALEAAITARTRWLILNHPSNPAGAMYSEDQLRDLGEVLMRYPDVMVLSDEIYEHIVFDDRAFTSFAAACPDLMDRTLTVNGVSKAYAMTGWRIGYAAGPAELIEAMTTVQSQATSGASSISQAAALAALTGPQDSVTEFCTAFERRRDLVVHAVDQIKGLSLSPPGGAFYALMECRDLIGRRTPEGVTLIDDVGVAMFLLESVGVALVPGSAYAAPSFVRISTASADSVLAEAMERIASAIAQLS